ncbi:MAG: hypothetical protein K2L31_02470, partial [Muribaculum sp.]|nr:hypothetical protein [Muribaculum sp.]
TSCMAGRDCLFGRVKSELLHSGNAAVTLRFPYPTGLHADDATDYSRPEAHSSKIIELKPHSAVIQRILDDTKYYVTVEWEGGATFKEVAPHCFSLSTDDNVLTFAVEYSSKPVEPRDVSYSYDQALKAGIKNWQAFWKKGAIVDFSECTDPRAAELERRTVLSQYLTAINCAGAVPPQETGLTSNSWFGRPHLEMTWWHAVDFALWNRPAVVGKMLDWYNDVAYPVAAGIASRQGFDGVRWMKMTDPDAGEAASNTGSFLIWQQPHYIYMAEEMYRANPDDATLDRYGEQVEATAAFMADYARACAPKGKGTIRLFGHTAMQESMSKDFSCNHPFELAYWRYGLEKAQQWRERRGLQRHKEWDDIIARLSPLPQRDGVYVAGEPVKKFDNSKRGNAGFDPYVAAAQKGASSISEADFLVKCKSDHPAVLGACGLLPDMGHYDRAIMERTLDGVFADWNWDSTWGWDYGMIAMCAARLGRPETAIDALLIDKGKNTYLVSGHNFQEPKRLRLYLPGNGSLLDAVAMMCAGWDGCKGVRNPGFPADGTWNVRWEGLRRMQ